MRVAIALALILLAALGGAGAGHLMRPAAPPDAAETPPPPDSEPQAAELRDPFVVPILRDGRIWSHVVLTLGIESRVMTADEIFAREPRLRDGLNRTLWTHGSLGGFDGDFTAADAMLRLRERLDAVAVQLLEDETARVLLIGVTRQAG
jgi:hypothetical protein